MNWKIQRHMRQLPLRASAWMFMSVIAASYTVAATLFESGTLGPTGIFIDQIMGDGIHPGGAVVSPVVFNGVRFELSIPAVTTRIGGHFVADPHFVNSFFGAIVRLDGPLDFPDSGDLSTPDVVGTTLLSFSTPSAEVFGNLSRQLDPGWFALVFGSGLYDATGRGAAVLNNPDIGAPTYFSYQPGSGWFDISSPFGPFQNYRLVLEGSAIPEPTTLTTITVLLNGVVTLQLSRSRRRALRSGP